MHRQVIAIALLSLTGCADAAAPPREPLPVQPPMPLPAAPRAAAPVTEPAPAPSTPTAMAPHESLPLESMSAYVAEVSGFFAQRLTMPPTLSQAELRRLCVTFQVSVNREMVIWHVKREPIRSSGNETFDEVARASLVRLEEEKTPLPIPAPELDKFLRGRTMNLAILADPHGDSSRCK